MQVCCCGLLNLFIGGIEMTFQNEWFNGPWATKDLPADCITECSAPGPADDAVAYWIKELAFDGPAWLIRRHLKGYGAWDAADLCDHGTNLERLLWIWACDCREAGGPEPLYLDG